MYLYHYSKEKYPELRTLEKQKVITKDRVKDKDYGKHISFFWDRVPLDILGDIYGKDHPVWFPGSVLWEYRVNVTALGNFHYEVVESPEQTELYYDNSIKDEDYRGLLEKVEKEHGYKGAGTEELEKAIRPLLHKTKEYFLKVPKRSNFEEIKRKYASTVPHLMTYPDTGIVKYIDAKRVTVIDHEVTLEAIKPLYHRW